MLLLRAATDGQCPKSLVKWSDQLFVFTLRRFPPPPADSTGSATGRRGPAGALNHGTERNLLEQVNQAPQKARGAGAGEKNQEKQGTPVVTHCPPPPPRDFSLSKGSKGSEGARADKWGLDDGSGGDDWQQAAGKSSIVRSITDAAEEERVRTKGPTYE